MRFKDHLIRGLHAWQPKKYRALSVHPLKQWLGTLSMWVVISIIIMFIVGIPKILLIPHAITQTTSAFDEFSLSANISLTESQTILTHPKMVVDLEREEISKERVLITKEGIIVKKPFWQGSKLWEWSSLKDIKQSSNFYANISLWLFLLLVPSLIIIGSIIGFIEALALIIISASIAFIIIKITKFSISFRQLIKISLICTIPFLMIHFILFLYLRWLLIPLILYFLLVAASIWISGESKMDRKAHHKE